MKYFHSTLIIVVALHLTASRGFAAVQHLSERINENLIVRLLPARNAATDLSAFIGQFELDHPGVTITLQDAIPSRDTFLLGFDTPLGMDMNLLEADLLNNYLTMIQWGEFLYGSDAPEGSTGSVHVDNVVGSTQFRSQYALTTINSESAHTRSLGGGTVVAVLDTGLDTAHEVFQNCIQPGGFDFIDNDPDPRDIGDGLDTDGDGAIDEMVGHGTFVSGLIIAVAPETRILPIRVLNGDGIGDGWVLAKGLYYAIDQGVDVINMSLRSTYKSSAVEDAVREAKHLGIIPVAAAGNFNRSNPREFPAMGSNALGVAATDDADLKAGFSNFNDRLFISAPGSSRTAPDGSPLLTQSIISTMPGNSYSIWEGTSVATPLVAGAAALLRAQHPEWPLVASDPKQIYDDIKELLEHSAVDIGALNAPLPPDVLGAGRLDIGAALCVYADVNGDKTVDIHDIVLVLNHLGIPCSSGCPADINQDSVVDNADLQRLLDNFGPCS